MRSMAMLQRGVRWNGVKSRMDFLGLRSLGKSCELTIVMFA